MNMIYSILERTLDFFRNDFWVFTGFFKDALLNGGFSKEDLYILFLLLVYVFFITISLVPSLRSYRKLKKLNEDLFQKNITIADKLCAINEKLDYKTDLAFEKLAKDVQKLKELTSK